MIRTLAVAGASLDAVNKDNKTPLLLAEATPKEPPKDTGAPVVDRGKIDSREDIIAALRELMNLGPNDPAPQPPAPSAPRCDFDSGSGSNSAPRQRSPANESRN